MRTLGVSLFLNRFHIQLSADMSPIVTTSSHREKPKINPLVPVMAVVILVAVWFLLREGRAPARPSVTPPPQPAPSASPAPAAPSAAPLGPTAPYPDAAAPSAVVVAGKSGMADEGQNMSSATETNASQKSVVKEGSKPKPMPYGILTKSYFDNNVED